MKKLVLGSLLLFAVATQATGCIITSDDDADLATITADWSIKTTAGSNATCPPGFNTVALYNQLLDSSNRPLGSPVIDLFDCAAFHGISDPLDPGVYQSWIEVTSGGGGTVYAQSTSAIVDVTVADKTFGAVILTDGGYFEIDWDLRGKVSNQALQCSQVSGISAVEVLSTINGPGQSVTDKFNCEDHHGITAGMLQGSYTVAVQALMGNGSLGAAPELLDKTVASPNKVTDLGNVIIAIDAQ